MSLQKKLHKTRNACTVTFSIPKEAVNGAKDLQSEAASRGFAACFPNAQFLSIGETGHFSFVEKPEIFAAGVRKFLNEKVAN